MLTDQEYIRHSLETNLFFLRIMKEHVIFASTPLSPRDTAMIPMLLLQKSKIEKLLGKTIKMANGLVGNDALNANEFITPYTLQAEQKTQFLTGIPIDMNLTRMEMMLQGSGRFGIPQPMTEQVSMLNQKAMTLTREVLAVKRKMLNDVSKCKAFTYMYPTMLHHVIEEAEFYVSMLGRLEKRDPADSLKDIIEMEITWTDLMEEHSEFIRGYLDPSEKALYETANGFAEEFEQLMKKTEALRNQPGMLPTVTRETWEDVTRLRDFKVQGTRGILACQVKSLINPLLSDHVTREANHYLRMLKNVKVKG